MSSESAANKEMNKPFLGNKILGNYVDSSKFFSELKKYGINEDTIGENSITELYSLIPKDVFNKAFFDCVLFNHLKNIYIYNIAVDKENFKSQIIDVLKNINDLSNIPNAIKPFLKKEGFNLMSMLGDETTIGDKFVLALEYVENADTDQARLLFSHVVPSKAGKTLHNVAALIIDFSDQKCWIMMKNLTNLGKGETPELVEKLKITLPSYRDWLIRKLEEVILFETQDTEDVRLSMYNICRKFDENLLKEDRKLVLKKLENKVSQDTSGYLSLLTSDVLSFSDQDKKSLKNSILSLINGVFVKSKYENKELQKKAKGLKLDGYPTRIQYTSSKLDKGATQSSSIHEPVASSEIYHSIYSNFSEASSLEKWSMAWFTDYEHANPKDWDVIQTTIYVRVKTTHIIFLPTRALDEEIVRHVIRKIIN